MKLQINAALSGKNLTVTVDAFPVNQYTEYAYYLYNADRQCLAKIWYTKETTATFALEKCGRYYVKVFVRGKSNDSESYWKETQNSQIVVLHDEDASAFFLNDRPQPELHLPFCKSSSPRQDILFARIPLCADFDFQNLAKDTSMEYNMLDSSEQATVVMTGVPLFEAPNHRAALSGIARTNSRLIFGMQDLDSVDTIHELSEQVGCFWCFHQAGHVITLEADYFGNEKLYYYSENGIFLASNRIHLILLAMKKLKIQRIPNLPKIHANLSLSNQLFMQNFAPEMDICGIYVLPVDSKIRMDLQKKRIDIEKTDLYYTLSAPLRYDEKSYRELLQRAADELVDNARIVLEHPLFENYIVHVTGGLDSRLVYAALSRLPMYQDRIIAQTNIYAPNVRDYEVAVKVISKYPVSQNRIVLTEADMPQGNIHLQAISQILGSTSNYTTHKPYAYKRACTLPGYFGEITGRAYYSHDKFDSPLGDSTLSDASFYRQLVLNHSSHMLFDVDDCLQKTLAQACLALPGRTNLEKFENHYLYYRNGLHFNVCHVGDPAPAWGILQSKSMLKLKYMTFQQNWGIRLQLDVLYLLNPEIASVEFESEKYQAERTALHKIYGTYPECTQYDEALLNEIKQQLEGIIDRSSVPAGRAHSVDKTDIFREDEALDILHDLYKNFGLHPEAAYALYHYIRHEPNSQRKKLFFVKLYSLYFELTL